MTPAFYRIREFMARRLTAMTQPDVARDHRRERASSVFGDDTGAVGLPSHVLVENTGSNTTVFSFASNALLFAGQPTFEMQGYLNTLGQSVNRVYLRDIHRSAYHLDPRGGPQGLAFYEAEVNRLMAELGGQTHIAIGDSSGGAAALYFGTRCGMAKVIAFSPPFPVCYWSSPVALLRAFLDWRLLFESRLAYREVASMCVLSALFAYDLHRAVGHDGVWDPIGVFSQCTSRPGAVIAYGERCAPDAAIAALLRGVPNARLVPVDTGRHNCSTVMGRKGLLRDFIVREVNDAMTKRGVSARAARPENPGTEL